MGKSEDLRRLHRMLIYRLCCFICVYTGVFATSPTITPTILTCSDDLEYAIIAATGYGCDYYITTGGVCDTYFCNTCAYPYRYCSETCGFCTTTYLPSTIPTLSSQPTITPMPSSIPSPLPSAQPTASHAPSPFPSIRPTSLPTVTSAPTISHFYVSTFEEFLQVLTYDRGAMTIEIMTPKILCKSILMIDQVGSTDEVLLHRNVTILSSEGTLLQGDSAAIMRFAWMGSVTIENLEFRNGTARQDYSGGLTVSSVRYVKLVNCTFVNNNPGKYITPFAGALSILSATVDLYNCSFYDNWAYFGGAMWVTASVTDLSGTRVYGENLRFERNSAYITSDNTNTGGFGGGIYVAGGAEIHFKDSSFIDNFAQQIYVDIWVNDGSFDGQNLYFKNTNSDINQIGVDDGSTLSCGPSCGVGEYGNCSLDILGLCFANCEPSCTDCPAGTANDEVQSAGVESCIACAPGFVSEVGASSCDICPTGKYATNGSTVVNGLSLAGASQCVDCSAGYYQPVQGGLQCVLCESGTISEEGAVSCVACETGEYAQTGSTTCSECVPGTFAATIGSDTCTKCASFVSSDYGATECNYALEGYYFPAKDVLSNSFSKVQECPPHSKCTGGWNQPQPNRDYWVERRSANFVRDIEHCPRKTCKGGATLAISNETSCWSAKFYNKTWLQSVTNDKTVCESDKLQCVEGASGPLCGSCLNGYIYSSSESTCVTCHEAWLGGLIVIGISIVLLSILILIYKNREDFMRLFGRWWIVGILSNLDDGALRVIWGSYQIIESVSWSLDVVFPYPYSKMMSVMSIFSFDFLPIDCIVERSNHFTYVYIWSAGPVVVSLLLLVSYTCRRYMLFKQLQHVMQIKPGVVTSARVQRQQAAQEDIIRAKQVKNLRIHSYLALLFSFVILPPVSRVQFQALDCVTVANRSYLRVDTSISCQTSAYQSFVLIDLLLIILYLSIPLVWVTLLYQLRHHIDPRTISETRMRGDTVDIMKQSDNDLELQPYRFLYHVYKTRFYYFEAVEM